MAREFAREFYNTGAWKNCAAAYKKYRRGLCEKCLAKGIYKAGVIVHHKDHLTPANITDPTVALDFGNLLLVCRDCHAEEHGGRKRYKFNPDGSIYIPPVEKFS